jgi:4'-phosphopantetheinyl transferase
VDLLPDDEIHVWLADPEAMRSPEWLERLLAVLGPLERDRHQRLRREQPRREFLVAHALARLALSRYARVPAESLSFSFGEHGRPEVSSPPEARWLRFNLSHTRGMAVCALVRELDIAWTWRAPPVVVRTAEVASDSSAGTVSPRGSGTGEGRALPRALDAQRPI